MITHVETVREIGLGRGLQLCIDNFLNNFIEVKLTYNKVYIFKVYYYINLDISMHNETVTTIMIVNIIHYSPKSPCTVL